MKYLRRQSWLVTLSLVLLAAGYVWFVFLPGKAAIGRLEAELNDRRAFVAGGHELVLKIERVQQELALARDYSRKWRPEPSGSAAAAARFGRIAQVLQQAGVSTTRFAPQATVKLRVAGKAPPADQLHGLVRTTFAACSHNSKSSTSGVGSKS